jgi:hypothetical protein
MRSVRGNVSGCRCWAHQSHVVEGRQENPTVQRVQVKVLLELEIICVSSLFAVARSVWQEAVFRA